MGERNNLIIAVDGKVKCGVYLHWGGGTIAASVQRAMKYARLTGDNSYGIRAIVQEVLSKVKGDTGGGIWFDQEDDQGYGYRPVITEWNSNGLQSVKFAPKGYRKWEAIPADCIKFTVAEFMKLTPKQCESLEEGEAITAESTA